MKRAILATLAAGPRSGATSAAFAHWCCMRSGSVLTPRSANQASNGPRIAPAILAKFIHAAFVCAVAWARPNASRSDAGSLAFWPMISLASVMALIMPFCRMMSAALADALASSVS